MGHISTDTRLCGNTGNGGTAIQPGTRTRYVIPPVVAVDVYRQDAVIVRRHYPRRNDERRPATRAEVTEFSKRSRARLAFVAGNTHIDFQTMITLTYPDAYPTDGKTVKRHLNAFLTHIRRNYGKPSYLWFLEFQKRGAPHIHMLLDITLPCGLSSRKAIYDDIAQRWYNIVMSSDKRHLAAGTRVERIRKRDGARRYCVKYASKMEQKKVPLGYRDCGRFWGCSRDVPPQPIASISLDDDTARAVIRDWPYYPGDDRCLYKVLYNTTPLYLEFIDKVSEFDITPVSWYAAARQQQGDCCPHHTQGKEVIENALLVSDFGRRLRTDHKAHSPDGYTGIAG